ncbi:hypothetical protein [Parabacteroides bouchesdurhonensis]|uniref:hypothetical protein n=1 Tax=Parabacteroides bouchesdurhonensis TaxID=1936995 RepID=UPI000E540E2F|nr:hypothetical protein [Parabacteroides bouchesdurhonensis]RHJ95077.1 hypothetical protein DW095_01200 [Bacteroides sp. AM07-16]
MKRYSKTVAQQCRYYEVENIHEYMVSTYINGNISQFKELYKELCTEARKEFISYLFDEVIPAWRLEIIQATIQ